MTFRRGVACRCGCRSVECHGGVDERRDRTNLDSWEKGERRGERDRDMFFGFFALYATDLPSELTRSKVEAKRAKKNKMKTQDEKRKPCSVDMILILRANLRSVPSAGLHHY